MFQSVPNRRQLEELKEQMMDDDLDEVEAQWIKADQISTAGMQEEEFRFAKTAAGATQTKSHSCHGAVKVKL